MALLLEPQDMLRKVGSAGRPPFFTDVRIVRPDLTDVVPGEVGEILVCGPNVMKGYWNLPELTEETIVGGRWLRTGDAARCDDEGYVYIVGRIADAYATEGQLVFPGDIEQIILDHPAVRDCGVVGVPDARRGEVGMGFVVPQPQYEVTESELLGWVARELDRPETLRALRFTDVIPRNPAGKILRQRLRESALAPINYR